MVEILMRRVSIHAAAFRAALAAAMLTATVLCTVGAVSWPGAYLDRSQLAALASATAIPST